MRLTTTADSHDLLAAERFLAAEARIAGTFGRIEEAVAPRRWCMDMPEIE